MDVAKEVVVKLRLRAIFIVVSVALSSPFSGSFELTGVIFGLLRLNIHDLYLNLSVDHF